jgi:hypothetical protein
LVTKAEDALIGGDRYCRILGGNCHFDRPF